MEAQPSLEETAEFGDPRIDGIGLGFESGSRGLELGRELNATLLERVAAIRADTDLSDAGRDKRIAQLAGEFVERHLPRIEAAFDLLERERESMLRPREVPAAPVDPMLAEARAREIRSSVAHLDALELYQVLLNASSAGDGETLEALAGVAPALAKLKPAQIDDARRTLANKRRPSIHSPRVEELERALDVGRSYRAKLEQHWRGLAGVAVDELAETAKSGVVPG